MQLHIASSGVNSESWLLGTLSENNYRALSENKFINNEIKAPEGIYILAFKDKGYARNREKWQCRNSTVLFSSQHSKQAHVAMWIVFRTPKKPLFEPLLW